MGLFNKKQAQSEMEILRGQQGKLQGESQAVQARLTQIQNGLVVAETNEMIDPSPANKKQVAKFKEALEKAEGELEAVGNKLNEVGSEIGKLTRAGKQAEIDEAKRAFQERAYQVEKYNLLKKRIATLTNQEKQIGEPVELKKFVGLKGHEPFNGIYPEHIPFSKLSEEAKQDAKARAEKEMELLMEQVQKFLNEQF